MQIKLSVVVVFVVVVVVDTGQNRSHFTKEKK